MIPAFVLLIPAPLDLFDLFNPLDEEQSLQLLRKVGSNF